MAAASAKKKLRTRHFARLVSTLLPIKDGIMNRVGEAFRAIGSSQGEMVGNPTANRGFMSLFAAQIRTHKGSALRDVWTMGDSLHRNV
jgi:hypothetical protein